MPRPVPGELKQVGAEPYLKGSTVAAVRVAFFRNSGKGTPECGLPATQCGKAGGLGVFVEFSSGPRSGPIGSRIEPLQGKKNCGFYPVSRSSWPPSVPFPKPAQAATKRFRGGIILDRAFPILS